MVRPTPDRLAGGRQFEPGRLIHDVAKLSVNRKEPDRLVNTRANRGIRLS